jgi:hypothetical protein
MMLPKSAYELVALAANSLCLGVLGVPELAEGLDHIALERVAQFPGLLSLVARVRPHCSHELLELTANTLNIGWVIRSFD